MRVREASIEDAPTIAKVTVDTWETAYRGIIDDNYLNNLPYEEREQGWRQFPFNNSFVYVAEVQMIISWSSYHLFTESVPLIHANDTGSF